MVHQVLLEQLESPVHQDSLAMTERKDRWVSWANRVTPGLLDRLAPLESEEMTDHKDSVAIQDLKVSNPACIAWQLIVGLSAVLYWPRAPA